MEALEGVRDVFGAAMLELGEEDQSVAVVVADSKFSSKLAGFASRFPDRFYDVGIAEQAMIGVAAGLAVSGRTVFVSAIANFASMRCFEQIRTDVAYPSLNVKVVAMSAGFSYPYLGPTHVCIEDIAIMRAMPNMAVLCPADSNEVAQVVHEAARYNGPVFIRLGRQPMADVYPPDYRFRIGKGAILRRGRSLTMFGTGTSVSLCLDAARELESTGVDATVVSLSTVKPIDRTLIVETAAQADAVVTVEEHNLPGGFGSAVAEVVSEELPVLVKRLGVPDVFPVPGSRDAIMQLYGLTGSEVARATRAFLDDVKSRQQEGARRAI